MIKILSEGDTFQGAVVTWTTDNFCFFGKSRKSWKTIETLLAKGASVLYTLSPNKEIDWSEKESVLNYYNSFVRWNTYISGCSRKMEFYKGVLDLKDGVVFYNGEYFLPAPTIVWEGDKNFWNGKGPLSEDGRYNVTLLKQENDWYPKEDATLRKNITLNLFYLGPRVHTDVRILKPNTDELWAHLYGHDDIIFRYDLSVLDGISFFLASFDIVSMFKKYFLKERWSDYLVGEFSDSFLYSLLDPIYFEVRRILSDALNQGKFRIDISESWGEISVPNGLLFDKKVSEEVFSLIKNHIGK